MEKYLCWYAHGELYVLHGTVVERMIESISSSINMHGVVDDNSNSYKNIVMDAMRINQGYTNQCPIIDEEPNANITEFFFFNLLKDPDEPLLDGCTNHNKLSVVAQVFNIKSNHGLSETSYDRITEWKRSILLEGKG
jgi:hypothetical protein